MAEDKICTDSYSGLGFYPFPTVHRLSQSQILIQHLTT